MEWWSWMDGNYIRRVRGEQREPISRVDCLERPDNLPIVMLLFTVFFFLWLSLRRAALNDEAAERGEPPLEARHRRETVLVWPDLVMIELICIVALTAFLFYPRPSDDRQTLQKIATHLEAADYPMAWDRTGDLEDEADRAGMRQEVVEAWQTAILSDFQGSLSQAKLIEDQCNQLLGAESDHPRSALAGPKIYILRARARARRDRHFVP